MGSKCAIGATVLASRIRNTLFLLSLFFLEKKRISERITCMKEYLHPTLLYFFDWVSSGGSFFGYKVQHGGFPNVALDSWNLGCMTREP